MLQIRLEEPIDYAIHTLHHVSRHILVQDPPRMKIICPNTTIIIAAKTELISCPKFLRVIEDAVEYGYCVYQHNARVLMLTFEPSNAIVQPQVEVTTQLILQHLFSIRLLSYPWRALERRHIHDQDLPRTEIVEPLYLLKIARNDSVVQSVVVDAVPVRWPIHVVDAEPECEEAIR